LWKPVVDFLWIMRGKLRVRIGEKGLSEPMFLVLLHIAAWAADARADIFSLAAYGVFCA